MSDRAAVALAVAVAVGAHLGGGPTPLVGALLALVAVAARRPWLICLAGALLAAGLADAARAGLDPVTSGPWRGVATLVSDPEPLDTGGVSVVLAVGGQRVEAAAHGPPAWALEERLAGERIALRGRLRPPPAPSAWVEQHRIVGRLTIDEVGVTARASPMAAAANRVRRTLDAGTDGMSRRARSLLLGVVLGDDREQPPELADDFRAAGLTHVLVVSGQNLAFVLVLARPLLAWLPGRARLLGTLAVLGGFAIVVRFEPSVLRAGFMAAVACLAAHLGRPAAGIRVLALAATVALLVDPLLVRSVGFGLSVGASAGILLLAPRIAAALPGPRALAEGMAVTLAAQAGALPLLLPVFGAVPVATLPANLLAVPVAGPLMIWGLTGGMAAGIVGDGVVRGALQLPSNALTWWLAEIAGRGAALPLGALGAPQAAVLIGGVVALVLGRRRFGVIAAIAAVTAAALSAPSPPTGDTEIARGAVLWRDGDATVVVVSRGARARYVLEGLRDTGARCVDVIAASGADRAGRRAVAALARRCPGASVVAVAGAALAGWNPLEPGSAIAVGSLRVSVDGAGRLQVGSTGHGSPGHDARPRAPPVRHHPSRRRDGDPQPDA